MWLSDPPLPGVQSACHHRQWYNEMSAIGPDGPLFPPVSSVDRSESQLLGTFNTLTDFSEIYSSSVEFRNMANKRSMSSTRHR
ncbi:hypothetical protein TNCV_2760751 [Trichonephila clavipes]|nr:hypothetical protein TNCV_2760751 [Trichonephila clavipes]